MPDQNTQPTVLVKKSDGTTVRMTLDEVKKMKNSVASTASAKVAPSASAPATITKVAPPPSPKATIPAPKILSKPTPPPTSKIISDSDFSAPFEDALPPASSIPNIQQLKSRLVPGVTGEKPKATPPAITSRVTTTVSAPTPPSPRSNPSFRLDSASPVRPTTQDVIGRPTEIGPVDEIRYINLVDFRRLSANPVEAAARFKQKFSNLKDESILLFLEALRAWREAPLYNDYLSAVSTTFTGKKLTEPVSDKNKIQLAEIKAIAEMNTSL